MNEDISVIIAQGNIADTAADAIIVPQLPHASSRSALTQALYKAAAAGFDTYHSEASQNGRPIASIYKTDAGTLKARYLFHTVTVNDKNPANAFNQVRFGFLNALITADKSGLSSIATPAIGTNNNLTKEESALAMLSAVQLYKAQGGKSLEVRIVIFNDQPMTELFERILDSKVYETVPADYVSEHGRSLIEKEWTQKTFGIDGRGIAGQERHDAEIIEMTRRVLRESLDLT